MNIHTGEKLHECDQCGLTFVWASNLKSHLKVNSKEKPHSCSFCGKRFSQLQNLKAHQKIHTGVREYMCFQCEKTFITAEHLKRIHRNRNTSLHAGFTQSSSLSSHKINNLIRLVNLLSSATLHLCLS